MIGARAVTIDIGKSHRGNEAQLLGVAIVIFIVISHHKDDFVYQARAIGNTHKAGGLITIGFREIIAGATIGGVGKEGAVGGLVDGLR